MKLSRAIPAFAAVLAAAGCGAMAPPLTGCTRAVGGVELPREVGETSGAAWSRTRPGVWWTLNDSGNPPELFAFDSAGRRLGTVRVAGAENRDWEDLAAGPCAGGTGDCLYVAEIGDNGAEFDAVTLYRVPEPAPADTVTAPAERFTARYPGGARDAEAVFVLPDGGAYVVTKGRRTAVELYRFPLDSAGTAQLQPVRVLAPVPHSSRDRVTGAGASPDGRWIAVRTYETLEIYRREALLGGGAPTIRTSLKSLREPQGEAVAVRDDGRVLLTTEGDGGDPELALLACPPR